MCRTVSKTVLRWGSSPPTPARERDVSKVKTHTQCKLCCGEREKTAWIPTEKAKIGKLLRIGRRTWCVEAKYATMPSPEAMERSRDHLHQREASDI